MVNVLAVNDLWPLFGLRIASGSVVLRLPREDELAAVARVAAGGVHRPGERPFLTPWAERSADERARFVLQSHWASLGAWTIDQWQLGLGVYAHGRPVGMVAIRARDFPIVREVTSSSWLGLAYHGHGFGTDARIGVLGFAFAALRAEAAVTEVFRDNPASQRISRKLGYVDDGLSRDRRGDEVVTSDRLRLTQAVWNAQAHHPVTVDGFDQCRAAVGL